MISRLAAKRANVTFKVQSSVSSSHGKALCDAAIVQTSWLARCSFLIAPQKLEAGAKRSFADSLAP